MPFFTGIYSEGAGEPHVVGDRIEMWVSVAILSELYRSVVSLGDAGGISFQKGNANEIGDQIADLGLSNIAMVEFIDFLYGEQQSNLSNFIHPITPRWEPENQRVLLYLTRTGFPLDLTVGADADLQIRDSTNPPAIPNEGYSPAFPVLPFDECPDLMSMNAWSFRLKLTGYPRGS